MGQLITTVAGGVLGFMIGGPFGAQVGMMIGGMVGSTLFGPTIKGPRLQDLKVTASTYGVAIPEIYGTVRVGGNMIWSSGIKETKKTSSAGGKGGPKQTTYTYDASFAMGLCKGPIDDVLRIWADSKLIYDATKGAARSIKDVQTGDSFAKVLFLTVLTLKNKKKTIKFRLYRGDEEQTPDSLIEADKGAGNVSAHRGMAYVVFEKLLLENFGNRIPQMTFEVTKNQKHSFPSITPSAGDYVLEDVANRTNVPLWETGRIVSFYGSFTTDIVGVDTMKPVFGRYDIRLRPGSNNRHEFYPPNNLLVMARTFSNSSIVDVYDMSTMQLVTSIGQASNSLSGYYCESGPSKGRLGLGNDGPIGFINNGSAFVTVGWERTCWIVGLDGIPLSFYRAPWRPEQFLMRVTTGAAYGWRSANDGLQYANFAHFAHDTETIGQNVWWRRSASAPEVVTLKPYPDEIFKPAVVLWDPTDETFFVIGLSANVPCVFKYFPSTGTYKFIKKHPGITIPGFGALKHSRLAGGTFGYVRGGKVWQFDLQDGRLLTSASHGNNWGSLYYISTASQGWDDETTSLIMDDQHTFRRVFFTSTASALNISDVITDICTKTKVLEPSDIDVFEINDQPIIGYMIDRECSARDALKQLATGYMFDGYESDYMLKFRSRGKASKVTITEDWIARANEGEVIQESITQELEMPLRITMNYYDITRDHQQGSQSARRLAGPFPTMWTAKEDIIDLPIVWSPDQAKQAADKMLKMAWANRNGAAFSLPWRYLKYDPTDVIKVQKANGTSYTLRVTELNMGADFTLEAKTVTEKATAYVSTAVGSPGIAPDQFISGGPSAYPIVINTPLLRDEDYSASDMSVCYLSAGTKGLSFSAASIMMESGSDYTGIGTVTADTTTGYTVNKLGSTTAYEAMDETSVLRVRLSDPAMELESVTYEDLLNTSANAALVGDEIIQFRDAAQQTNGEWWLTGLRRARRGTNYGLKTHAAGEQFLLLSPEALIEFSRPPESFVTSRNFKAVVDGETESDAVAVNASLVPRDLMPYTPEDAKISDDGTTVTITIQRRARVTAPLTNGSAVIGYYEGDKLSAKITYKVWPGLGLGNMNTVAEPVINNSIALFDANGNDVATTITFPLTDLGESTKFLIKLYEVGKVEGIPKWIEFERLSQNRWNKTDFY